MRPLTAHLEPSNSSGTPATSAVLLHVGFHAEILVSRIQPSTLAGCRSFAFGIPLPGSAPSRSLTPPPSGPVPFFPMVIWRLGVQTRTHTSGPGRCFPRVLWMLPSSRLSHSSCQLSSFQRCANLARVFTGSPAGLHTPTHWRPSRRPSRRWPSLLSRCGLPLGSSW